MNSTSGVKKNMHSLGTFYHDVLLEVTRVAGGKVAVEALDQRRRALPGVDGVGPDDVQLPVEGSLKLPQAQLALVPPMPPPVPGHDLQVLVEVRISFAPIDGVAKVDIVLQVK